jgi:NADH dehydrogenase
MHRVVVLGAGYAGLPAANRIARQTRRAEVELVLISGHDQFVERPRLHQLAAGQPRPNLPLSGFLQPGTTLHVGQVHRIDAAHRTLHLHPANRTDRARSLHYDTLLYAPGSTTDLRVPGAAEHAHSVATPESSRRIATTLTRRPEGRIVVCGGGLTGLELVTEIAESFPTADVTLVTGGPLGGWLSERARRYVRGAMDELAVKVFDHTTVERIEADHVRTTDGDRPFDMCLWAGGFVVPQLAARARITVDPAGRVVTDSTLRSLSHPDVYAIGDAAAVPGPWGDSLAMGCRTGGFTGPTAADALVARLTGRPVPEFAFRYFHECISLGRRRAVIQFVDENGRAIPRTLRGRKAVLYKDLVLRAGRWTGKHPGPYRPVRRRHLDPALPAAPEADPARHVA